MELTELKNMLMKAEAFLSENQININRSISQQSGTDENTRLLDGKVEY